MRIPSGLNDDNQFRRRHQKNSPTASYRSLLRLGFALVLVIVVMQKAGQPGAYRLFFPESAQTIPAQLKAEPPALAAGLSESPNSDEGPEASADSSLDETYLKNVNDGATWKKEDNPAFYRLLEGTPIRPLVDQPPRHVGVIQLLQQPDVYLRTRVAIHGHIARVEQLEAKANEFGVSSYWEIWLQPNDGSNRPVAFYAREVPSNISTLVGKEYIADGPDVEIEGVYLKRLAFRSAAGNELAPAIIGHVRPPKSVTASIASRIDRSDVANDQPSIGLIVIIAAVLGIGAAVVITIASAAAAKRMRQARLASQQMSEQLIASLSTELESREQL